MECLRATAVSRLREWTARAAPSTRRVVAASLAMLASKRERATPRRHTNGPL